jgi:CheY-like chemotaxis protein
VPQTLLLADDSVTIQRVIELTFADEDINVVAVSDGDQAIARLDTMPPDIVLVDVGMPGRSGYDVADHIKHTPHLSHIPVVLLTGAFEPVDEVKANAIGCDGVLAKPFEPQNVISRVKELLGRPAAVEPMPALADGLALFPPELQTVEQAVAAVPVSNELTAKLDEYFDQLDSAFARFTSAPVPTPADIVPAAEGAAPAELDWFAPRAPEAPVAFDPSLTLHPPSTSSDSGLQLPDDSELVREFQLFKAPAIVHRTEPIEEEPEPEELESEPEPAAAPEPVAMPELAAVAVAASEPVAAPDVMPAPESVAALAVASAPEPVAYTQAIMADEPVAQRAIAVGEPLVVVPSVLRELPPLGDAFAAILAAEQGDAGMAAAWPAPASAAIASVITDDVIDRVSRRVIEQLTDRVVREAVAEAVSGVAERLVREEIERIKSAIKD